MVVTKTVKLLYGDKKVIKNLVFREIHYDTAKRIILKNHYSHKWNANFGRVNIGVFENNELYGVASFGYLMQSNSYKNFNDSLKKDNVVELNRLWVDDCLGKNVETVLLSASWKIMKSDYPEIKVIQSFADGRLGVGTIYKASSFKYFGYETSLFFENVDTNVVYHKVPFTNTKRPDGMIKLNTMAAEKKLKAFEVKTYRYIYLLDKKIKINFDEFPYPNYEKGFEIVNYDFPILQIVRAYVMAYLLGYYEKELMQDYIIKNANQQDFIDAINNESLIEIAKDRNAWQKYLDIKNDYKIMFKSKIEKEEQTSIFDF